jgi:hypothetical protein
MWLEKHLFKGTGLVMGGTETPKGNYSNETGPSAFLLRLLLPAVGISS